MSLSLSHLSKWRFTAKYFRARTFFSFYLIILRQALYFYSHYHYRTPRTQSLTSTASQTSLSHKPRSPQLCLSYPNPWKHAPTQTYTYKVTFERFGNNTLNMTSPARSHSVMSVFWACGLKRTLHEAGQRSPGRHRRRGEGLQLLRSLGGKVDPSDAIVELRV